MIARLGRFIARSYPPLPSVVFAVAWAYGVTGLYAAVDRRPASWGPDGGTALAAATLVIDLLLMRAIDDIRDLDYDRRHNPDRPLASGAVRRPDLVTLIAASSAAILALNAGHPAALAIVAAQVGYGLLILALDQWLHWLPSGDNVILNLLLGFPFQLLLQLYLYAGYLRTTGLTPDRYGLLAVIIVMLATTHVELARKVVRAPAPGTRTYVTVFGVTGAASLAMGLAYLSLAILALAVWPSAWLALGLLPLLSVTVAGWRFWLARAPHWPAAGPALYLLLAFVSYFSMGLA